MTELGRAVSSKNATKHGLRSAEWTEYQKEVNALMREFRALRNSITA